MTTCNVVQTMSLDQIQDRFVAMGRGDNFSMEALEAIMDMLEEYNEEDYIDLDVIAICCEFTESPLRQFIWDYGLEEAASTYDDEIEADTLLAYAEEHTWAVILDNGNILYANF